MRCAKHLDGDEAGEFEVFGVKRGGAGAAGAAVTGQDQAIGELSLSKELRYDQVAEMRGCSQGPEVERHRAVDPHPARLAAGTACPGATER
jgi:hypothetical protein